MNISNIVREYLIANGYDGLYQSECGCKLDDLMPCEYPDYYNCRAGVLVECPGVEECELACYSEDGKCGFHIGEKKG